MFETFLEFVGMKCEKEIESVDEFFKLVNGASFLNGLYRVFEATEVDKWNKIVGEAFPQAKDMVRVFGYDWMGRIFAVNKAQGNTVMLEPGTGEILSVPANVVDFHDVEIAEYPGDSLASGFFEKWYELSGHYQLKHNECVGYKIPLFLGGKDNVENLEASDMEVYWEIMIPLMHI